VSNKDSFNCRRHLEVDGKNYIYYDLKLAEQNGLDGISQLPFSMKVLLEILKMWLNGCRIRDRPVQKLPIVRHGF